MIDPVDTANSPDPVQKFRADLTARLRSVEWMNKHFGLSAHAEDVVHEVMVLAGPWLNLVHIVEQHGSGWLYHSNLFDGPVALEPGQISRATPSGGEQIDKSSVHEPNSQPTTTNTQKWENDEQDLSARRDMSVHIAQWLRADLDTAEARITELERQRDAVLALCDQADGSGNASDWNAVNADAIRAIYADMVSENPELASIPSGNEQTTSVELATGGIVTGVRRVELGHSEQFITREDQETP